MPNVNELERQTCPGDCPTAVRLREELFMQARTVADLAAERDELRRRLDAIARHDELHDLACPD